MTERLDLSDRLGASPGYAYVARASGETIYTAGAVPVDRAGNLIGPEDLAAQTRAVVANLEIALEAAGAAPEDVVKTTIYVATDDRADLPKAWQVFSESPYAAAPSTLVGVRFLGYSGQLVEIEAIAVR